MLEQLFERPLGQTPNRHRSWLWWQAFRTSGLASFWSGFTGYKNSGLASMEELLRELQHDATDDQWTLFSKRLGYWPKRLRPRSWHRLDEPTEPPRRLWSKGGCWDRFSPYTRIIWFGDHLKRDYSFNAMASALGPTHARAIEYELFQLIDPDSFLHPDAIARAVEHAAVRIPYEAGWKGTPRASGNTLSWFFQTRVPDPNNEGRFFAHWLEQQDYSLAHTRHGKRVNWAWLPEHDDE